MTITIDPRQELADAAITPFHRRLCVLMGLLTLFDGYDTFNPAYVIHYVAGPWGLRPGQAGWLMSSGLIGFLVGAGLHGLVADRFGRRITLLGGLWIMSVMSLATAAFAHSFVSFCALRSLTGIGLGALFPLATTYVSEFAPRRMAHTLVLRSVALGWATGGAIAGLAGVFITPWLGWQALYWLGGSSLLLLPWLHRALPESPQFLSLAGRHRELRALLSRFQPRRAALYRSAVFEAQPAGLQRWPVGVLLGRRYRRTTAVLWSTAFLGLFCVFGLSGWIPTVMMKRGEGFAASFGFGALLQAMSFLGALCCGWLIDRRGASSLMLSVWWAVGSAAIFALVAFEGHAVNRIAVATAGFCCIGAMLVLNNVAAAAYETAVRASGVGMMLGVGRVGAILGPFVAGWLQQIDGTPTGMFIAIGTASALAGAIFATLPRRGSATIRRPPSRGAAG